jgi:hypothetical protein
VPGRASKDAADGDDDDAGVEVFETGAGPPERGAETWTKLLAEREGSALVLVMWGFSVRTYMSSCLLHRSIVACGLDLFVQIFRHHACWPRCTR